MPFIIPNATDTTSGNKYAVLDQSEPDSLDFEILGNDTTGVISGCAVTPVDSGGNTAVSVAGGVVVLNGVVYTVAENTYLTIPATPTTPTAGRFDLIVARLSGSTMAFVGLYGTESVQNPTLPRSSTRLVSTAGMPELSYFNPSTDVAIASVYRAEGVATILSSHIIDKRRTIQTPIAYRGTAIPAASQGSTGDLYLRTSSISNGESGVYVKRDATTWQQLAGVPVDPGVPVGTVITWVATTAPNGAVWLECNGALISRSIYSQLFSVLGTEYGGGDGSTTFNLPDFRGMYLAGLPTAGGSLASPTGNINHQTTLTMPQIPEHDHTINHSHSNGVALDGGVHTHTPSVTSVDFATRLRTYADESYIAPRNFVDPGSGVADDYLYLSQPLGGMAINYVETTAPSVAHTHEVSINLTSGLVSGKAGQAAPSPVSTQPRTMYVKYYIRCA